MISIFIALIFFAISLDRVKSFVVPRSLLKKCPALPSPLQSIQVPSQKSYGTRLIQARNRPLRDILGLGPAEIALALVAALVLFGPETLKSLSKDVGKAAAELKEIPKTFKEGMDEGAESVQVAKMKAIAAEKRKLRDEKLKASSGADDLDDNNEDLSDKTD